MNAAHQWLGMGALSDQPVVGYLARSTSAFYAILGGLFWALSFDLRRHRPVLRYVGSASVLLGVALFAVDRLEGLPAFWQATEGPIDVGIGIAILWLAGRVPEPGAG